MKLQQIPTVIGSGTDAVSLLILLLLPVGATPFKARSVVTNRIGIRDELAGLFFKQIRIY